MNARRTRPEPTRIVWVSPGRRRPLPGVRRMTIDERARQHHAAIVANVNDWYADRIDFATFGKRASALHAASRRDGPEVEDALGRLIAAELPGVGGIR